MKGVVSLHLVVERKDRGAGISLCVQVISVLLLLIQSMDGLDPSKLWMVVCLLNLWIFSEKANMVICAGIITKKNRRACDSHLHAEWHSCWLFWETFCV